MGNALRNFGANFKRKAVRHALHLGNAIAAVVQDLGIHESLLRSAGRAQHEQPIELSAGDFAGY